MSLKLSELLKKYNISPKKSLGQNFLTDSNMLDKIVAAAELNEQAGVLEIGPGLGSLTERLLQKACKVVAVEIDQRLVAILKELFSQEERLQVIGIDILRVDLVNIIQTHFFEVSSLHVVSNLPYYITAPILNLLLQNREHFKNIVVMMQKEVAERLMAKPGSKAYGSLSIFTQYYTEIELVTRVPRQLFQPPPKVDSVVLRLTPRPPLFPVTDEEFLFRVVRTAFTQRRKTMINNLMNLGRAKDKGQLASWLLQAGIPSNCRAEALTIEDFVRLVKILSTLE